MGCHDVIYGVTVVYQISHLIFGGGIRAEEKIAPSNSKGFICNLDSEHQTLHGFTEGYFGYFKDERHPVSKETDLTI